MDTHENLVIGRLGFVPEEDQDATVCSAARLANTYEVSRLGLVFPTISSGARAYLGLNRTGAVSRPRRGTYKMPAELLTRLKDYAVVVNQYQYVVVTKAVSNYLDRASERHFVRGLRSSWWKVVSAIRHPF